jgi:hypothetical protein
VHMRLDTAADAGLSETGALSQSVGSVDQR